MQISDEAVEAATNVFPWQAADYLDAATVRAALEAAAPHIEARAIADALEEVAGLIEPFSGIGLANGATRSEVAHWIRTRAASIRANPYRSQQALPRPPIQGG